MASPHTNNLYRTILAVVRYSGSLRYSIRPGIDRTTVIGIEHSCACKRSGISGVMKLIPGHVEITTVHGESSEGQQHK